jgi:hypothetical protein
MRIDAPSDATTYLARGDQPSVEAHAATPEELAEAVPRRRFARATEPTATALTRPNTSPVARAWASDSAALPASRSRPKVLAAAGIAAVVAAGAGFVLGGSGSPSRITSAQDGSRVLEADGGAVRVPAGWTSDRPGARRVDTGLADAKVAGPKHAPDDGAILGTAKSIALPSALVAALDGQPEAPDRVRLDSGIGLRYDGLRLADGGLRLRAYVLPTDNGATVLVCHTGAAGDVAFASVCEGAARTMKPAAGRRVVALGPSEGYAEALSTSLADLQRRRSAQRERLERPNAAREQAVGAKALAGTYAAAAKALAKLQPPAGDERAHAELRRALADTAGAYAAAGRAAEAGSRLRYAAATASVRRAEKRVARAQDAFGSLGYSKA